MNLDMHPVPVQPGRQFDRHYAEHDLGNLPDAGEVAHFQRQQAPLPSEEPTSGSPDRRPKKSSSTCTTCRTRKVRCNGSRPLCGNCQRLGFPCSYDDNDHSAWPVALPRRRVKQACASCHGRKARCSGHVPACDRCRAHGIDCVYRPNRRLKSSCSVKGSGAASPQSHTGEKDDGLHDSDRSQSGTTGNTPNGSTHDLPNCEESFESLIDKTFDNFFRTVHHIPGYSFFHRASLSEQYHAGKVDRALLLAFIGVTSCLTDLGPGMRDYGDRCIDEAEELIFREYARPSTIKTQALALMVKHRILNNKFPSAFMLLSIASRYATALRLNHESPDLCFLAQESRRRLVWALYSIDCGVSGGYRDFTLWRAENIDVGLPCNERNFEFDLPQPTEKLDFIDVPRPPHEDVGANAWHIRILHLRQKIVEFNKSMMLSRNVDTGSLQSRVLELHKELDDFANHLPASFQFSESSLRLRAYSPRICVYVMIHVWWRQCHCDLYRLALVGLREALPRSVLDNLDNSFIEYCQRQCVDHSLEMVSLFASIQKLSAKFVADLDLGICAYQCARMLTYAYHTNSARFELEAEAVLAKANVCLQTIKQCCMGSAADGIRGDLEKLITQGLSARPTPSKVVTPENGTTRPRMSDHTLSRHLLLKDVDGDSSMASTNSNTNNAPSGSGYSAFPPSSSSGMAQSSLPPSIMTDPWAQESPMASEMVSATSTTNRQQHSATGGELSSSHSRPPPPPAPLPQPQQQYVPTTELNNAYEGAIDGLGLGLDNGLDYALGLDMNMWAPSSGDWMITDFNMNGVLNGGVGV